MTPDGWRPAKFGDVASLEYGKSLPAFHRKGGTVAVCGSNGIIGYHAEPLVDGPGIVVGRKGSVGVVTWIDSHFWPIDTTYYVSVLEDADTRWLYYAVSHLRLERLNEATGIPGLNRNTAAALKFDLPPLPEQHKIAAILSSVDDAIEKTRAVIDQVQVVKRGLMQELLTLGLPGQHTRFKQTAIGYFPEVWAVRNVGALAAPGERSCVGGPFGSDLTRKDYVDSPGVPVIRGSNLSAPSAELNEDEFVFVSDTKANALQRNMAYPGNLIFTQRGTLGQVCRIPSQSKFGRYVLSQSQMKLSVDKRQVNPDFVLAYFRSTKALKLIELMTIGTGVPHLNLGILKAFPVPVPPLEEQSAIVDILSATDARFDSELQSLRRLKDLRAALMSVLLTGELRVTPDPENA